MKTLVIFYSLSGKTKAAAQKIAAENSADLLEIFEKPKRNLLTSFVPGCPQAMKRKQSKIIPPTANLESYNKIIIGAPIWAGPPAPAFNSICALLPQGKEIELFMTSGSGNSAKSKAGTIEMIEKMNCKVINYSDIKEN